MADIQSLTPYIEVFDMEASVAFYRDMLGFDIRFASPPVDTAEGHFSHFVRLGRGPAELMLNTAYDANRRPAARDEARWAGCRHIAFYLLCDDVHTLHAEIKARGVDVNVPLPTGYGYLAFTVSDPDGYGVTFHQPL